MQIVAFLAYITLITFCPNTGAPNGGGGVATPLNFGWGGGVEHLSTPPDFEKIFIRRSWLLLN